MSQALSCGFGFGSASIGGGGSSVSGAGTPPKMPVWTGANTLGDSQQSDNGTTVFIGTSATSTSAMFEVKSTTQGALFPRMTTIERDLIPVGATEDGLFIYNTSAQKFQYYDFIALAWITVESSIIGGETWSQTLTNGAISGGVDPQMSNGDVIKAVNGGGQLNLRSGSDGTFNLTSDNGGFTQAWMGGDTTAVYFGFGVTGNFIQTGTSTSLVRFDSGGMQISTIGGNLTLGTQTGDINIETNDSSIFFDYSAGMYFSDGVLGVDTSATVSLVRDSQISFNLNKSDFTKIGSFALGVNDSSDYLIFDIPNYAGYSSAQDGKINQNVINTWISGGTDVIAKTNNANYSNQFIFNAGLAGEMALVHTPNASDFTATLQAKTGTIAYLSDLVGGGGIYGGSGTVPTSVTANITDNLTFGTNLLFINEASSRIGIGTSLPNASSLLDMTSTTQGFLTPRMTSAQRVAIGTPATGLLVYQTDGTAGFYYYNGSSWVFNGIGNDGIYGGSGTVPSTTVATLTDEITFSGGQVKIIGSDTSPTSYNFWTENNGNEVLTTINNSGWVVTGQEATTSNPTDFYSGSVPFTVKTGESNGAVTITNATLDGTTPNTTAHNTNLHFTTRDSAGNVATTVTNFIRNRNVTAGSVYGVWVMNSCIQTENADGVSGQTLVSTRNRHTSGGALSVFHVENRDDSASRATMLIDAFEQNTQLGLGVRSGTGVAANTWSWQLLNNHQFTHNFGQLTTGDFIMRGLTDVSLFRADASSDRIGIGEAVPTAKLHIVGSGSTIATSSLLIEDSANVDMFKINDNQTAVFGTYIGAKASRTTFLINGNSANSQADAIGLHVKANIDDGTDSNIALFEHTNTSGGTPSLTSNVLKVVSGWAATGSITGLVVGGHGFTGIGVDNDSLTQLKVNHIYDNYATPPYDTVGFEVTNNVSRVVAWGVPTRYKYGAKIISTGIWENSTVGGNDAVNIGLDVTVSGGELNYAIITSGGNSGFGVATPTAVIHLEGGTATANTSPLKFNTGTLNTVAETGAFEFASDFFYTTANAVRTAISTFGRTVDSVATYTVLITDRTIGVTRTTTGAALVNLPSAALYPSGYQITIKDEGLNATTNNITIDASASQTIDGNLTEIINVDGDSRTIYSNGVDAWFIV